MKFIVRVFKPVFFKSSLFLNSPSFKNANNTSQVFLPTPLIDMISSSVASFSLLNLWS